MLSLSQAAAEPLSRTELSKRGKAATALVEVRQRGNAFTGSAFCIDRSGLFLTNEHVVNAVGQSGAIRLVLDAALPTQRVLPATLVRSDKELDLALLRVEGQDKLASLPLGDVDELTELTEVVACGFPFGTNLATTKQEYPAVSINICNITSLRRQDGQLVRIQLDAVLNPGNSGGPVIDKNGKVVGVVVSGVRGAGVNFAIPVTHATRFLARPELVLTPPTLTAGNRHEPVVFQARAVQFVPEAAPLSLELILEMPDGKERRFAMAAKEGVHRATAVVVPAPTGPRLLQVSARFGDGSVRGPVADQAFTVDGQSVKLSEVRRLSGQPKAQVTRLDGRTLEGPLAGLDAVSFRLGKQEMRVNLARATEVQVEAPGEIRAVKAIVIASQAGKEVARARATVTVP